MTADCSLAAQIERQLTRAAERPRYEQLFNHLYSCQQPRCKALRLALGLLLIKKYLSGPPLPAAGGQR